MGTLQGTSISCNGILIRFLRHFAAGIVTGLELLRKCRSLLTCALQAASKEQTASCPLCMFNMLCALRRMDYVLHREESEAVSDLLLPIMNGFSGKALLQLCWSLHKQKEGRVTAEVMQAFFQASLVGLRVGAGLNQA